MPRDLESEHQTLQGLAPLARTDDQPSPLSPPIIQSPESMDNEPRDRLHRDMRRSDRRNALHPTTSTLTLNHVDECVIVENECFPPEERCSREKFEYRLRQCGEICFGIYTSAYLDQTGPAEDGDGGREPHSAQFTPCPPLPSRDLLEHCLTGKVSPTVDAGDNKPRKRMLLGHIIATRSDNLTVKDSDMEIPPTYTGTGPTPPPNGHRQFGTTICLHSLAVLPQYASIGLGTTLLQSYLERIKTAGGTDRIALLAHDALVPYYERVGFINEGASEATFGGTAWNDMVYHFPPAEEPPIQSLVGRAASGAQHSYYR